MRLYLAGPMTGRHRWNFDAFEDAAALLRNRGYSVLSPAEMDLAEGFDPDAPAEEFTEADGQEAMRRDLAAIVTRVNAVAVLPGWDDSRGASLEVAVARAIGLPVLTVEDLLAPRILPDLEVYPV
ncbi:nucleoside deoxyribosyltransferase [Arthrobacter phage VroomVroom]|uniref:Nucleoside deoxyribosyltransferase n=1 Tax=Arthrobacter phage VroomVroom TaxID=3049371 RepID=A0AA49F9T6_9CAUD|nr:nucleoside deoxyribosyltransferase [Arthrobacter phage VroomVroom]